jgi:hypothetical protein
MAEWRDKPGMRSLWRRFGIGLAVLLAAAWPQAGQAAVEIDFYSHDFGKEFPHAFVVLKGTLDSTGEKVDTNLGYSALRVTPAILFKSVPGGVDEGVIPEEYIARSTEHFSLMLSDEEYRAVMAVEAAWKARPQPSYNINDANCVHFVSDVLLALHMKGEPRKGLMRSPHSFLDAVTADSRELIAAHVYRPPITAAIEVAGAPQDAAPAAPEPTQLTPAAN